MVGSRDRDRTRDRVGHREERHRSSRHKSHTRRSPDCYYRTDNNSDDSESYDNNRRHRNQDPDRYDSDRRERTFCDRRDRSRSKDSRDRDRDRDGEPSTTSTTSGPNRQSSRHFNEDYNQSNNDFANNDGYGERSYHQRDKREEIPNNTIMIRGLAPHICENDIVSKLTEHCLQAKDIRLMRKKETGISRGFAFVEFSNIEHAIQWKQISQGYVLFDEECEATVHYSIPKDSFGADKNIMKNDWTCYKCGVNNFKRREECFKCGTPKEESMANDTGDEMSLTPTNALLLSKLSAHTTEERILTILGSITALPIKSIRILKEPQYNISRCMCLVELHTTLEASQLFTLLSSMSMGFMIDDSPVQVNYGKRNASLAHNSTNNTNAAIVALAAAQWRNLESEDMPSHSTGAALDSTQKLSKSGNKLGTVCVNGVEYQKYETPNVSTFQFDESSGYYYDLTTGFYYDSNTQYYFNSQTQQYLYWEPSKQTYLSVESKGQPIEEEKKEKPKDVKQDKVKIAKKIAKDMEKWAKTLNQKKETARSWAPSEPILTIEPTQSSSADAGFAVLEQQVSSFESELIALESVQQQLKALDSKSSLENKNQFISNVYEIIRVEEKRLTDWDKLACLLCKRQFSSPELLTKHQQLSDLHKTNLNVLKHKKLSDEQIDELDRTDREGYRDRAKERRKKYGIPETPETSKLKTKYLTELEVRTSSCDTVVKSAQVPISGDNIGNKMMKAMGWQEGTGLGKKNQGMSNIIEVERRKEGVGLGIRGSVNASPVTGETYKDAVRRAMALRFKEMHE